MKNIRLTIFYFATLLNNTIPLNEDGEVRRGLKTRRRGIIEAANEAIDTCAGEGNYIRMVHFARLIGYITTLQW
jgi:hypothetical protein